MTEVTRILSAIDQGNPQAAEQLLLLVYDELRKLAVQKLAREKPGQTLQATALVHEAYLRLVGPDSQRSWNDRGHFFAAAARAMRRILVDNARRKRRLRHGGGLERVELDCLDLSVAMSDEKCLRVDEALNRLAVVHPQKAEVIKLRLFTGLQVAEIATVLGCSGKTIQRDWTFAKAWISRELRK